MIGKNILISVVVPVYNVENYLAKCVDSLINQTYKNKEILLIDDGSSDSSGNMCDEFAKKNKNIRVFHKENGGLSDARNYAIPYIKGQYVAFVDSDDYVDVDYLERMISPAQSNDFDIVISTHINETSNGKLLASKNIDLTSHYLTPGQALETMCYEIEFGTSACGKLISRTLVESFAFPTGKLYEDLATIYKMIGASRKIIFLNMPMYHYIQRGGSIRNSNWKPSVMDIMEASQNLLDYIDSSYPDIHKAGVQRYFFSANELYIRAFNEEDYLQIVEPIRKKLKTLWPDIKTNPNIQSKQFLRYWMLVNSPCLYRKIWQLHNSMFK